MSSGGRTDASWPLGTAHPNVDDPEGAMRVLERVRALGEQSPYKPGASERVEAAGVRVACAGDDESVEQVVRDRRQAGRVYPVMQTAMTNAGACAKCGVDVGVDELRFTAQGEVCGACAEEEEERPATLPSSALYGFAAFVGGMFITVSYDHQSGASLVHVDLGAIVGGLLAIGFGGKTLSFGRRMGAARRTAWGAGLVLVVLGLWSVTTGFVVQ